jgi:NAD-dependent deacetylase
MASTVDVERLREHEASDEETKSKVGQLASMINESRRVVFYTGAGVSTSAGVGDYRGPTGAWTKRRQTELEELVATSKASSDEVAELTLIKSEAEKKDKADVKVKKVLMMDAQPTLTHMAQATLIHCGKAKAVVTTNLGNLRCTSYRAEAAAWCRVVESLTEVMHLCM